MAKKPRQNEASLNNLKKGKKFSKEYQPTGEAKSEGWQAKIAEEKETEKTVIILSRVLQKLVKDRQGQELTAKEAMLLALLQKALKGDIRAIELIIKLIGEMPADKQEVTNRNGITIMVEDNNHQKMMNDLQNVNLN